MLDVRTDGKERRLINFLVNSPIGTIFLSNYRLMDLNL